jgi:hypothetical protein
VITSRGIIFFALGVSVFDEEVLFGRLRGCNELRLFSGIVLCVLCGLVRLWHDRDDWQRPLVCRLPGSPHGPLLGECLRISTFTREEDT